MDVSRRMQRALWRCLLHRKVGAVVMALSLLVCPAQGTAKTSKDHDIIVLGMSTALTGPTAELGKAMKQGVLVGLSRGQS